MYILVKPPTYPESTHESYNNTSDIDNSCINADRIKHHPHLLPRSNEEGCAASTVSKLVFRVH